MGLYNPILKALSINRACIFKQNLFPTAKVRTLEI